ncbi:MAG: beta-glucosidase, partial [Mucilaginibacter sp.]|nr:beta-glucosidase [Mucilaginibacter sp.]
SDSPRDVDAAVRVDALLNRLFIEPVLGLGYPPELTVLTDMEKYILPGDMENLRFDFDFIGLQNYTREIVKYSFFTPYIHASLVKAEKRKVPTTAMGWEVYPASIYHILKKYDKYPQIKKIYLTESGAAFADEVIDHKVDDPKRVAYLQEYLGQVLEAKNEGCKVNGYFIWTLTDNFEWAEGYHPRFGIIYVDFETQQRIVKSSGLWYAALLG